MSRTASVTGAAVAPAGGSVASRRWWAALGIVLLLGVSVRLVRVNAPIMGVRDADTAAVARNYYEESMNIFYPRVDWRGSSPGYVEAEFPIYSYLLALTYHLFGVQEWLGRAFNIAVYALSAVVLFRLTRDLFDEAVALLAAFFYTTAPLAYYYTLTFQPDALMALGSIAGIYWFWRWTETDARSDLVLSCLAILVAVLIKPTSLYLGLPLLYLAARRFGWGLLRRPALWVYGASIVVPCAAWYYHSWTLWDVYGNTFGILGGWNKIGAPEGLSGVIKLGRKLWMRLMTMIASPAGVLLLAVGLFRRAPRGNYLLHWWTAGFAVAVGMTVQGQFTHAYYQLPMVFTTAAFMAGGAARMWRNPWVAPGATRAVVAVLCVSVAGFHAWDVAVGTPRRLAEIKRTEDRRLLFAAEVERATEPDAPIVFVTPFRGRRALYQHRTAEGEYLECESVDFYRSHRKGWSLDEKQATPEFVEELRRRGARYVATGYPEILERHPELEAALDASYEAIDLSSEGALYRLD